jgi:ankyrin repeat protein
MLRGMATDPFFDTATEDWRRAEALVRETPSLAIASPHHALVLGDADGVGRALADGRLDVTATGGPLGWAPLVYVCFSRYAQTDSPRTAGILTTARLLIDRGADPNAGFHLLPHPGNPLPCLYGATGYNNNADLARLLIDAGARLDDGESVYHSSEHADLACLRLLLARGARVAPSELRHMLDREDVDGTALMLDAGADPNAGNERGETALHWAVWRDRSPAVVRLLLDRGAAIDARRVDGRTAYAMAVLFGRRALADLLGGAGADTTLSAVDRFVEACVAAAAAGTAAPAAPPLAPADAHLLPDLANGNHAAGVLALLAAGAGIHERGEHGATALHFACWNGQDALVAALLARGADTTIEDRTFHATPPGWLVHGAQFCPEPRGDYAAALGALLGADAVVTAAAPTGRAEVDAILRERGLLGTR